MAMSEDVQVNARTKALRHLPKILKFPIML